MSYESPIRVFVDDMVDALTSALENDLHEAVLHYGVAVDKAELIKALNYDRDQYAKGYTDGQKAAVKHGHWIFIKDHWECSNCGGNRFHDLMLGIDATYCGRCGAKMDEEDDT